MQSLTGCSPQAPDEAPGGAAEGNQVSTEAPTH